MAKKRVEIAWDSQDPQDEGWAYYIYEYELGDGQYYLTASGSVDTDDPGIWAAQFLPGGVEFSKEKDDLWVAHYVE